MVLRFLPLLVLVTNSFLFSACGVSNKGGGSGGTPIEPISGISNSKQVLLDLSAEGGGLPAHSASHEISKSAIGGAVQRSSGSSTSFSVQGGVHGAF